MNAVEQRKLQANIPKYAWYKVFTKRLYLPLITIQLVSVGKVSVEELAIIAVVSSIVTALLQLPGGYFADKFGNRTALITGALISVTSPLFYVFMPNFTGGLIASVLFFGGWAFQGGAIEAFMHDTLKALKRDNEYSKVMGRAQSYGLLANVVLIALVPATYAIDTRLPFIIGFFSLVAMLYLTISFHHPARETTEVARRNPFQAARSIVTLQNVALFIFIGVLTGVTYKATEFRELALQDFGVAVAWLGLIASGTSLAGAAAGWYVHAFDRLSPKVFYLLDVIIIACCFIVVGLAHDILIASAAFIILGGYSRVRMIAHQSRLFKSMKHTYKATLLSALSLFTLGGELISVSIISGLIANYGFALGHAWFGAGVLVCGLVLVGLVLVSVPKRSRA